MGLSIVAEWFSSKCF